MSLASDPVFTTHPWHLDAGTAALEPDDLPLAKVRAGSPSTASRELVCDPATGLSIGIWEHTAGESVDVEADEVFVVLSGRATITYEDGSAAHIGPGSVVAPPSGVATTWTVHEDLRKVYVVREPS